MNDFSKDHYSVLGLRATSTAAAIKSAYRRLVKENHPDLHPDDPAAEERIKAINEAYEVLGDPDERAAYDEFLENKRLLEEQARKQPKPGAANTKSYTRKQQVYEEQRTYLRGEISIKYRGRPDELRNQSIMREAWYNLQVTRADARIMQDSVFKGQAPADILAVLNDKNVFRLRFAVPVHCTIIHPERDRYYRLSVTDLSVPEPQLVNVTKHENESFGELRGTFYGYVKEIKQTEKEVHVTECFGETGRREDKTENGIRYYRKEYYHTDCSTYWGNWIPDLPVKTTRPTGRTETRGAYTRREYYYKDQRGTYWGDWTYQRSKQSTTAPGCAGWMVNLFLLTAGVILTLAYGPQLAIFLGLFLLPALFRWAASGSWRGIITGLIGLLLFGCWLMSLWSANRPKVNANHSPVRSRQLVVTDRSNGQPVRDTLLSHELSWNDYDGNAYHGRFWVNRHDFQQSRRFKNTMPAPTAGAAGYDRMVYELKEFDKQKLSGLYRLFDSVKTANKLSATRTAEMIVSFVQRIPYVLVLPQACEPGLYEDVFIQKYLNGADSRCDANERFGINTPVEFTANLKGDCDTRTLLLYTVLSRYGYDVALLSSEAYGHSMLGIRLPYDGAAYTYNGQRYVFWETTTPLARPGIIAPEIADINNWRISLKSTP